MINPLLLMLAESRHVGDDPVQALLKQMMTIRMSKDPACIMDALCWEEEHGEPTFEKLEEWAAVYVADPANAEKVAAMRQQHRNVMASFTEEEHAEVAAWMPAEAM